MPIISHKVVELRFPTAGVVRRLGFRDSREYQAPYPTPWACNVRPVDQIQQRLRGGSRPGLTKYHADAIGTTVVDMKSIQVASSTGTKSVLVILADSTLKVLDNGTLTTPTGRLTTEAGAYITTEAGAYITLSTADAPASAFLVRGGQYVYAINSSSIVRYDPQTGVTNTMVATYGSIPTGVTFGCTYRDRLILAGADNSIYLSAMGDYSDWDYGGEAQDMRRAFLFQVSEAADIGSTCTALIPNRDSSLLAATTRTLWVLKGDPVSDGQMHRISQDVGILSPTSWSRVGDTLYFLSRDGMYSVQMDGSNFQSLSGDRLPMELWDIDLTTTTVTMGYDHENNGVHLFLTTEAGGDTHWVFDLDTKSYWPMTMQDDHVPTAVEEHEGQLLLAGTDGYLRYIGGADDDGVDIESHVLIGPMQLGRGTLNGIITSMTGIIGESSGTVTWRIVAGGTPEKAAENAKAAILAYQAGTAYSQYVRASGSWIAGISHTEYPRVNDMHACLWLSSTDQWAYEDVVMDIAGHGRYRCG